MATLRKGVSYRGLERAYTRKSKYRAKAFVRGAPPIKITRYDMGNCSRHFPITLQLQTGQSLQLRHNCIEAARMTTNKLLETSIGKANYRYLLRMYPHHVLRENPLASGAGADRMSTGMAFSFGKPIGTAARIHKGQIIAEVHTERQHLDVAKKALHRMTYKLPCTTKIIVLDENAAKAAA
ncbi:50S ribosomal protein L16 [Candidatus Woesearchaeota archaeon]|nr:50S ribosomal protein L16 [Candidatus Woesearchaeota archaeon]